MIMMLDRPILFSAAMIQANLDLRKKQTRRMVKPQPDWLPEVHSTRRSAAEPHDIYWPISGDSGVGHQCGAPVIGSPYGRAGDLLWVRENFRLLASYEGLPRDAEGSRWLHEVDWAKLTAAESRALWRAHISPAIHMPRFMSRMTLALTEVRMERLWVLSEADAQAEGIWVENVIVGSDGAGGRHRELTEDRYFYPGAPDEGFETAVEAYQHLWIKINGQASWDANPWVWVLSYDLHLKNVDTMELKP